MRQTVLLLTLPPLVPLRPLTLPVNPETQTPSPGD
jgi:hypothetical protein